MTFDWFMHFCRDILSSRFTHFFRRFFEIEKWNPQTFLLLECMPLPPSPNHNFQAEINSFLLFFKRKDWRIVSVVELTNRTCLCLAFTVVATSYKPVNNRQCTLLRSPWHWTLHQRFFFEIYNCCMFYERSDNGLTSCATRNVVTLRHVIILHWAVAFVCLLHILHQQRAPLLSKNII